MCHQHKGRCKHTTSAASKPCRRVTAVQRVPSAYGPVLHSSNGPTAAASPHLSSASLPPKLPMQLSSRHPLDTALLPVLTCCQALDLLGEGGTEQHGLALAGGGHVLPLHDAPAGQQQGAGAHRTEKCIMSARQARSEENTVNTRSCRRTKTTNSVPAVQLSQHAAGASCC